MDRRLEERLTRWHNQISEVQSTEKTHLEFKANEKVFFSQLFLSAGGKNVAEKEAIVYSSEDWQNFKKGQVEAETQYNRARRDLELKAKAFDAEYLTYKIEAQATTKGI